MKILIFLKSTKLYYYFKRFVLKRDLKSSLLLDIRIFFYSLFKFKHSCKPGIPVIVSLTSYPARISTVKYTVFSLLWQSVMPEKIILWLGETQFPNGKGIPLSLLKLQKDLFEIRFTDDIKSYKKLIPALKTFPDKIIVTADDDIYYKKNWLDILWCSHKTHPDYIIAHRGYLIEYADNAVLPYNQWGDMKKNTVSQYNFPTSGAGILYPPHCFYRDINNQELFMKLAPYADDIWFYFMVILNNKKIYFPSNAIFSLTDTDKGVRQERYNQDTLKKINIGQNKNDEQFKAVFNYYSAHPVIQNYFAAKENK